MKYKVVQGFEDCSYNGILGNNIVKKKFSEFNAEEVDALQAENKELFDKVFVQMTKKEANAQAQ